MYTPLSDGLNSPGPGTDLWIIGIAIVGIEAYLTPGTDRAADPPSRLQVSALLRELAAIATPEAKAAGVALHYRDARHAEASVDAFARAAASA